MGNILKSNLLLYLRQLCYLLCCCVGFTFPSSAQLPVNASLFNDGWTFHRGDLTVVDRSKDNADSLWHPVDIPHDWSVNGPFNAKWASATGYLPGGIGWYRKFFKLDKPVTGSMYFIYFEGVSKNSKVWLNGHLLGVRPNGFVSFYYDLTPYLNGSGSNELLVKVDHSNFADSRWYTGSGIYRNVSLINLPAVNIPVWGIKTEVTSIENGKARLQVTVDIKNTLRSKRGITVDNVLVDASGKKCADVSAQLYLGGSENKTLDTELAVETPAYWSPEMPYLYTLVTTLNVDGKKVEQYKTNIGLRSIRFNADSGLFLNGRNIILKGVCIHDEAGSFGTAVPLAVWKERLKLLKQMGCNAIRMTHNPHSTGIYNLCDQMGFLVIDEAFDEWALGKHKWITGWNDGTPGTDGYHTAFSKWWKADLSSMIERDLNHPSIIMWSIGNEIDYPNDPYSDPILNEGRYPQIYGSGFMPTHPPAGALSVLANKLSTVVKALDRSRPVTAGLAAVMMSDKVGYTKVLDIAGYNYQEYRYEEDHKRYPERIIYGSENGHGYSAWKSVIDHPFVMGQFLWTGIDYLGEASKWPSHGNEAGLITLANYKKPEYYFRQSIWSEKPVVYLGTSKPYRRLNLKNGRHSMARPNWNYKSGDTVNVYCFTNCERATLYLNRHSLGTQSQNDSTHVIVWRVAYQPDLLSVKATSGYGQKTFVSDSLQSFGQAAVLKTDYYLLDTVAGENKIYAVDIQLTDKSGIRVLTDSSMVRIRVSGGGKLIGLENGNVKDNQAYGTDQRRTYQGRLKAYVQTVNSGVATQIVVSCNKGKRVPALIKEVRFNIN